MPTPPAPGAVFPAAAAVPADPYRALRKGRRVLVSCLALCCAVYYPVVDLAVASVIPVVALFCLGLGIGFVGRGKTLLLYGIAAWLAVAAVVVRRAATLQYSPHLFLFDGALAGYPGWSIWFAEVLRVGVNLWSLWLGAKGGRRARFGVEAGLRRMLRRG